MPACAQTRYAAFGLVAKSHACCFHVPVCLLQTEHDFNLEKQMLVTNSKLKMREEYEHKKKELQVQMLMCVSPCLAACTFCCGFCTASEPVQRVLVFCYSFMGSLYFYPAVRHPRVLESSAAASSRHETS